MTYSETGFFGDDCVDSLRRTPLHFAAMNNRIVIAIYLIAKKEDINAKDVYGRTPMWYAIQRGHEHMVPVLCKCLCNLKVTDHLNQTLLDIARQDNYHTRYARFHEVEHYLAHQAEKDQVRLRFLYFDTLCYHFI